MLYSYFKSEKDEKLKLITDFRAGSWVHLANPDSSEIDLITKKLDIPADFIKNSLDDDEKPRIDEEEDSKLIIFRFPWKERSVIKTIPLGIIITKNVLVTVCSKSTLIIDDFVNEKIRKFHTSKRTRFIIQLLTNAYKYYINYLDSIERELDKKELKLLKSVKNQEVIDILRLQKTLVYFNAAVLANGIILNKIMTGNFIKLYKEDSELLEDVIVENKQARDMIRVYYNLLVNTMNASASIVSNNLNSIMKILTSITIILSFPTIVASIYGMNVGLPMQENPYAFIYVILIALMISLITAIIFFKKKWM